jgi:FixJ family two-component response regulator
MDENPSVLIVDDDPEFRESVGRLLRTVGLHTREFSSVSDFLKADPSDGPTCLVLDVRMPGRSGLELQRALPLRTGKCRSSSLRRTPTFL